MKYSEEIIKKLATTSKPLSPYDLKKETKFPYSGIRETIKQLCSEGYVQLKSTEQSKKGGTKTFYFLTFKGALKYLSWFELIPSSFTGNLTPKNVDEFKKRFDKDNQTKILEFLEKQGQLLDYTPFQESMWLSEHYVGISRLFVNQAQFLLSLPSPGGYKEFIDKFKKSLLDPGFPFDMNDLQALYDSEGSALKVEFGKLFLQSLIGMNPKGEMENKKLREFAEKILNEKRNEIKPLELVVTVFSEKQETKKEN